MKEFTIEELEKILNEGNFDSLIGKIENNFFECKSQIYDLKNNHSKQELAKDVSSFANSNGGYILIGLKTRKSEIHFGDEVVEKSFLDQNLVDPNQYKDVIKDWIYPNEIQGIEIYWKASQNNSNKGIIIIKIPPQKESLKPFLISKIVEEGEKISETIFGYAERKGDRNESKKIEYIHKIIQDGLFYNENLKNRFDNLEALIQQFLRKEQKEGWGNKDRDIINKRINEILQSYENKRIIVLAAYPEEKLGKLKSLFTNEEGSIKRKLENPPLNAGRIRHAGWSLETLDIGKIIKGQFVRVQSGNTKTI
ncbi:MAG: ATP-binding protein, partial [candidate division WOR-3 bacterium]